MTARVVALRPSQAKPALIGDEPDEISEAMAAAQATIALHLRRNTDVPTDEALNYLAGEVMYQFASVAGADDARSLSACFIDLAERYGGRAATST